MNPYECQALGPSSPVWFPSTTVQGSPVDFFQGNVSFLSRSYDDGSARRWPRQRMIWAVDTGGNLSSESWACSQRPMLAGCQSEIDCAATYCEGLYLALKA